MSTPVQNDDFRSELFQKPVLQSFPVSGGRSSHRIVRFIPPHDGYFEVIDLPPTVSASDAKSLLRSSEETQKSEAKKHKGKIHIASHSLASDLVSAERNRWKLWAMLSDHVFGIEKHDIEEIQRQLAAR